MRAAIFLDRDGTLIEDRGFLRSADEVAFFAETVSALQRVHQQLELFIVTNQSGIGRGLITGEDAERVNAHVVSFLAAAGINVRDVYVCPHTREDGCECHKPKPFFLHEAAKKYGIDLSRSFVIGDHPADVDLAAAVGATGIFVLTGHGEKHRDELTSTPIITRGIADAIDVALTQHAARTLQGGGLVAFPTETVYGLGANAEDPRAVARVFEVKGRPKAHPLIVHLSHANALSKWAARVPKDAELLASRFWPGALTLILERAARVPVAVTGGQNTVGLRVPGHPLARAMIGENGVAAPSANRFGKVSPTEAAHVLADLGGDVDFVLDGGPSSVGIESTIVDLSSGTAAILRPGGVSKEELEEVLKREIPVKAEGEVRAPGMLASHYAPRATVVLAQRDDVGARAQQLAAEGARVAVLAIADIALAPEIIRLMRPKNVDELAHDLYRALRDADAQNAEYVVVELPSDRGIGAAILDRLKKASA